MSGAGGAAIDADLYRHVMGHLPTGVTVVTAETPDGPAGMACNSFAAVSLEPPLVSLGAAKTSSTWPAIREAGRFCVNVMAGHHEELARRFSRRGEDRFEGVAWHPRSSGPGLDDAVAWVDCRLREEIEAGDHTIAVAEVEGLEPGDGAEPLLFWRGRLGSFTDHAP